MILYGLKTCDTCRKALKMLPEVEFCDIREGGVPQSVLKSAYTQFGAALMNTRSTTWRGLSDTDKARPPLDLLAEFPSLMKRPLIDTGGAMFLGWTKDVQSSLLG